VSEDFPSEKAPMHTMYAVWGGDGRRRRCFLHTVTSIGRCLAAGVCALMRSVRTFELRVAATMSMLYKINDVRIDRREIS
jgi:hypothetical protein